MHPFSMMLLTTTALAAVQPAYAQAHRFHADHVLGTSLDVVVTGASHAQAEAALEAARAEIDRLDAVLSGWRPDSELALLNASIGPFAASPDLFAVIGQCEAWRARCGGAFSARLGGVEALWREGERTGRAPTPQALAAAATQAELARVRLDPATRTIDRDGVVFAVDALAKGYIIDSALRAGRAGLRPDQGLLLDIGGDLACAGPAPTPAGWRVGVASGAEADNCAPTETLTVRDAAVATSGGGARDRRIGDNRFIHVLQPASGESASDRTVTVVAAGAANADALATALGVLPITDALNMARDAGAEARIVDAEGAIHTTEGWRALAQPAQAPSAPAGAATLPAPGVLRVQNRGWPAGYGLEVSYEIPRPQSSRAKPPYVAIWITDANGKLVRTLFHLGNHPPRFLDSNYVWLNALNGVGKAGELMSFTRPSRGPGRYTAQWDGKADDGSAVPQGRYTVNIETSREHGGHSLQSMTLNLGAAPAAASADAQTEAGPAAVRYGPPSARGVAL